MGPGPAIPRPVASRMAVSDACSDGVGAESVNIRAEMEASGSGASDVDAFVARSGRSANSERTTSGPYRHPKTMGSDLTCSHGDAEDEISAGASIFPAVQGLPSFGNSAESGSENHGAEDRRRAGAPNSPHPLAG